MTAHAVRMRDEGRRADRRRARAGRRPAGAPSSCRTSGSARSWRAAARSSARGEGFGVPLVDGFAGAEAARRPLRRAGDSSPDDRLRWASRALAAGLAYVGADFRFDPPVYEPFELPSIAVIGTGKRVGKTAVSAHLARLLARDRDVVVVTMGRGGPPEPELVESPPDVASLVALSRSGRHAASDHLEIAAVTGVPTIGCRRAGGGLAGPAVRLERPGRRAPRGRPRARHRRLRRERHRDPAGRGRPPRARRRPGPRPRAQGFDLYRRLISDLVVTVGCELPGAFAAELRLRPLGAARRPRRRVHRGPGGDRPSRARTSCTSRTASATASRCSASSRRSRPTPT